MAGFNQEEPSARASVTRRSLAANSTAQQEQATSSYRTPAKQNEAAGTLDPGDTAPASASAVGLYVRPPAEVAVPARKIPWATIATAATVLAVGVLAVIVLQGSNSSDPGTEVLSASQELPSETNDSVAVEETETSEGTATSAAPDEVEPSTAAPSTAPTPPSDETGRSDSEQTDPEQTDTESGEVDGLEAEAASGEDATDPTDTALLEFNPSANTPMRLAEVNENSTAYTVYSDGELFLRGRISEADAEPLIASAESILGPENVFNEFVYDDSAEAFERPFFVEDLVLFDTGGTEIQPDFDVLISAGVLLLQSEPTAKIIVLGFTDSIGNSDDNIALSEARVQTILDRAVELGANPAQLEGRGLGEADPIGDNGTEAGRQLNRRVEFIIEGIIG